MTLKQHVKHRIVIVDDSPRLAVQLGEYIRGCIEGAKVLVFQDGLSAWKELTQTDPDVLITDMHRFSDMSGWDMLPLLAERNVKYPILLITGYREENASVDGKTLRDVHDLLRGECSNLNVTILRKPFSLPSLMDKIAQALSEMRQRAGFEREAPMTNEQIIEAQKLIAGMRDELCIISGISNDADKLIDYIVSSRVGEHLALSGAKLWNLVAPQETLAYWSGATQEDASTLNSMYSQLSTVLAIAEMSKRRPDVYKPKLPEATAKMLSVYASGFDKIEQSLATQAPESTAP